MRLHTGFGKSTSIVSVWSKFRSPTSGHDGATKPLVSSATSADAHMVAINATGIRAPFWMRSCPGDCFGCAGVPLSAAAFFSASCCAFSWRIFSMAPRPRGAVPLQPAPPPPDLRELPRLPQAPSRSVPPAHGWRGLGPLICLRPRAWHRDEKADGDAWWMMHPLRLRTSDSLVIDVTGSGTHCACAAGVRCAVCGVHTVSSVR